MNVRQVYEKFSTPKNLQEHMLRVAALSKIILNNWVGQKVDKIAIVQTCALHDMAKPIIFDISKQAQYGMPPEDIANLEKLQTFLKSRYGVTEEKAVLEMCKDVGMGKEAARIIENLERQWKSIPRLIKADDINSLVPTYCDMRIGPRGMLPLRARLDDLNNRGGAVSHDDNVRNGGMIEQKIKDSVAIDLNSITDEQLNALFPELLNLEI
jgi:hypothetical protein